ncbi:glycine oxidase ThiO [Nitrosospira sp. Nsp1]|uniref:glycine oxidase ThiO n=1 Tax=Nitrosospira sp. Nsp1 TaxID=136547 RepID=UPI000884FAD5|nr:glycine oxidase ThiO [Nitrosospira sp. Nsp1]SCX55567.1 glycine oxidase [Nitrosospira sp. Nsp1]
MSSDIIVIGGGIAGLTVAHELLRLGATVTILERQHCAREASWAGGGILSPLLPWNYSCPVTRLTQLSNALFPKFIEALRRDTGIDPEYQASGMLVLAGATGEPDSEGHGRAAREAREHDAEAWCARHDFRLSKVRSHEIAPLLASDEAALWLPDVCQVRNPRLLQALMKAVGQRGGVIKEHVEITDWQIEHGRVQSVSTSTGEKFTASNYIVTAGAWSGGLLREHALKLDIWPVRGQILLFQAQSGLLPAIVLQEQDNFYLIPRRDGYILAGSTLEETGFDRRTTAQAGKLLLEKTHALVPALTEATLSGHWAGLRPGSPDNIPVIGSHPHITNLYLNSGHYRYGITMAPGSAQLISNMILNKPQPLDIAPYKWPS